MDTSYKLFINGDYITTYASPQEHNAHKKEEEEKYGKLVISEVKTTDEGKELHMVTLDKNESEKE